MGVSYCESPLGILEIKEENKKIISVQFVLEKGMESDSAVLFQCRKELEEYFAGERTYFDVDLYFHGTDFQKKVWELLAKIPYGKVVTYKEIACQLGDVYLTRVVANAISKNPLLILVPCHRVIGTNGNLTGYRGGIHVKKKLLELEQSICF